MVAWGCVLRLARGFVQMSLVVQGYLPGIRYSRFRLDLSRLLDSISHMQIHMAITSFDDMICCDTTQIMQRRLNMKTDSDDSTETHPACRSHAGRSGILANVLIHNVF